MSVTIEESRRLTGANLYFDGTGAALEAVGQDIPDALIDIWREAVFFACAELGWRQGAVTMKRHASGVSLAYEAPADQLNTAVAVNEWALGRALRGQAEVRSLPRELVETARDEAFPQMMTLMRVAEERGIPVHWDDEFLTTGDGAFGHNWPIGQLPDVEALDPAKFKRVPKAVVTGSNGKTTVTRALAATLALTGKCVGFSSTDGVTIAGQKIEKGDFSGPMGLRTVMRDARVEVGILETARGGLLRRGLATQDAEVAVVTNVSEDHFGEYGVHTLEDLVDVKLLVRKSLRPGGTLVLNAGDALLAARGQQYNDLRVGWFGLTLETAMRNGLPACGVRGKHLWVVTDDGEYDLGATADMPISMGDRAEYNLENLAAVALAAHVLGVAPDTIAAGLRSFGADPNDNRGRLQFWTVDGVNVLLDYAHNPDGLRVLLRVAMQLRGSGRMGIVLGQAGNRSDDDIRALATITADTLPDRVWLKELGGTYLRGREEGEVVVILNDAFQGTDVTPGQIVIVDDIEALMEQALAWARPGDLLVLPIHVSSERDIVIELLNRLASGADSSLA